ncbi:MAG: hypothetical protein NWF05_08950 [Candidatus Bathyarchaeota archaeon]|nr:hypothetical protein [Candidatus Bathyarchaeota archaeon]
MRTAAQDKRILADLAQKLPSAVETDSTKSHLDRRIQLDALFPFMLLPDCPNTGDLSILDRRAHRIIEAGNPIFDEAFKIGMKHRTAVHWLHVEEGTEKDAKESRRVKALIADIWKKLGYTLDENGTPIPTERVSHAVTPSETLRRERQKLKNLFAPWRTKKA